MVKRSRVHLTHHLTRVRNASFGHLSEWNDRPLYTGKSLNQITSFFSRWELEAFFERHFKPVEIAGSG